MRWRKRSEMMFNTFSELATFIEDQARKRIKAESPNSAIGGSIQNEIRS